MGVKQLYSFMLRGVPDGLINVQIKDEIEKYKRLNKNEKPKIIIDFASFAQFIFINEKEILLGGRYNVYNERVEKLCQSLNNLEADIYLIKDGPSMPEKLNSLLKRRHQTYINNFHTITDIGNGKLHLDNKQLYKKYQIDNLWPYLYNMKTITKKYFNVFSSIREGDQDIAYWANEIDALAIISWDTDFLIFEGNWKLWSANHFNPDELTIKELNKCSLRKYLSLSDKQLILLATLASNDFVSFDMIEHFHRRRKYTRYNKFQSLAKIVRTIRSLAPNFDRNHVNYLVNIMFKDNDREIGFKMFWESVNFYSDAKKPPPQLENIEIFNHNLYVWTVLNNVPSFINLFYFDLTKKDLKNYYFLIQSVIQRQIGVILKNSNEQSSEITRKFYVKTEHDQGYYALDEKPDYPEDNIPPLTNLCLIPMGQDEDLDMLRKKLLCWMVSAKVLNIKILNEIPSNLILSITIILFLLENKQINIDEADCLLFASIPSNLNEKLSLNQFQEISNSRNFRLSFLYQRLFSIIGRCFKILGLKCYSTLQIYDGLIFHYLISDKKKLNVFRQDFNNLKVYKNINFYKILNFKTNFGN